MLDRVATSTNRGDPEGRPDLSVIIVNWNTQPYLEKCLRSVRDADPARSEIIVIENASADESAGMVRSEFRSVKLIQNQENLGFAKASNQGIKMSCGRYVLLLNPDCEVGPGALGTLVRFGDQNPEVGLFGPRVLNVDGSLQYSCRRFPTLRAALFRNTVFGRLFPNNPYTREYLMADWDHSEPRDVDWLSGAALMLRREMLDKIGLLDERFFMYCEDVDIAYRAKQHGWRATYSPMATVVHALGKSSDHAPNRMILEFHKSMYAFFKKHYSAQSCVFTRALVPLGLFARAGLLIVYNCANRLRLLTVAGRQKHKRPRAGRERRPKVIYPSDKGHSDES